MMSGKCRNRNALHAKCQIFTQNNFYTRYFLHEKNENKTTYNKLIRKLQVILNNESFAS